jgi:hypothetical protein
MRRSIIPIITKKKLSHSLPFRCSQVSILIFSLTQDMASSAAGQKKYIPAIKSMVYIMPGMTIHFQNLCCWMKRWASDQDWKAITISLSKT